MFSKNRGRVLEGDIAARFLTSIVNLGEIRKLLSDEHFSVDGTLVEAWASQKNLKPRKGKDGDGPPASSGRNEEVEFRGRSGSNQTHASTTDPDAMLYRKGAGMEAKLCFIGHALMENRKGLLVEARLTKVSGHAERLAALRPDHRTATLVQGPCTPSRQPPPQASRCWRADASTPTTRYRADRREPAIESRASSRGCRNRDRSNFRLL